MMGYGGYGGTGQEQKLVRQGGKKAHKHFAGRVRLVFCEGKVRLRVAEVVRRHEGPLPKSLDLDENFKH